MKEIKVGLRISVEDGVSFFGLDEVNSAIEHGVKVIAIKPGSAIMDKVKEGDGNVKLRFSGFSIIVMVNE